MSLLLAALATVSVGAHQTPANAAAFRRASAAVLFWSQARRDRDFRRMERFFPAHLIRAGGHPRALPPGRPLPLDRATVTAFIRDIHVAGVIVVQDGRVRLERYARGYGPGQRWTSFSVAKSFTSTLVGAALKDGAIRSLDDPVTRYLPTLAGSGYDGVTVRQVLTMTSGVLWNEDYTDARSDVARFYGGPVPTGADPTLSYLAKLPREAAPGTRWHYNTGETNLIGSIVLAATGRSLADYAAEKIAGPAGFARPGIWQVDAVGHEFGGSNLSLGLRDYARFGQFVLDGGRGQVPDGWFADAMAPHHAFEQPGRGYGYQWWSYPDGAAEAQGIYGQLIHVDPQRRLVIVVSSAYPRASARPLWDGLDRFVARVTRAADQTRSRWPSPNPASTSAAIRAATTAGSFTLAGSSPG